MSFSAPTLPITLTVTVNSTLSFTTTLPFLKPHFPSYKFKSLVSHCSISDREEHRWLREEQRWLREEQRWIREENRWSRERDELLREISELKLQVQSLERRILSSPASSSSTSDAVANVASLLQVLKDKNLVLESGSSQRRLVFDEEAEEKESEEVVEDVKEIVVVEEPVVRLKKRIILRTGSEGDEVQKLQEALLKLGFYSGEEDMEFSCFSSGTERAVKTWQASVGVTEDGIMTSELLDRLDLEIRTTDIGNAKETKKSTTVLPKEVENGAAVASVTEISEVQQNFVGKVDEETDVSHPRVFLLGENRWEEPSRLLAKGALDKSKNKNGTTKCLQCSGLGILLCTECDGTGEPNIEPQFMEWVGEDTKCPYCEGLGHTICDLCEGKTMV
ncbi:unnamed protein product [Lathyrus oleraceus]|uniref:Peptidoglycan binding-like domain-containing protein n=1 Tax=Pisum sativum TaxID=3888 RepID=A0A9D4WB05_PEA|nr:protein disulfide isomerase pTAC5, chloroplastic [Pisum sativum]KAI5398134.1 hypothetical protein KIW84_063795 [Pisum sativum]